MLCLNIKLVFEFILRIGKIYSNWFAIFILKILELLSLKHLNKE